MVTVLPDKMEFGELKRSVIIVPCVSFFEDIYSIERNFDFRGFFQYWEWDHRFFDRIDRFCDRKIDSIMKKIVLLPSIFFKDQRNRFAHSQSFSKMR